MKLFELSLRQIVLVMLALTLVLALAVASPAQSPKNDPGTNNPPPSGAIKDLSGSPVPGGGNNTYQQYTVSFVAGISSTAITFAAREDPAFISLSNVVVTDVTTNSGNLLLNGDFSQGTYSSNGNPRVPNSWIYANQYGAQAGGVVDPNCGVGPGPANAYGTGFCWFDGAVQAYDAISQTIATTVGDTYQISFWVADDSSCGCNFSDLSTNGNTTGTGGNGINVAVYAQAGLPPPGTTNTIVGQPVVPGVPQTFNFNTTAGTLDVVTATFPNTNLGNSGAIPIISNSSVPPTSPNSLWANSPLATASCIAFASVAGNCSPKLEVCASSSTDTSPTGAKCPFDTTGAQDVLLADNFDPFGGPITPSNLIGDPGVVALNDTQGCPFTQQASLAIPACPSNGLKSFTGHGEHNIVHGGKNSFYHYVTGILSPHTDTSGFVTGNGWVRGTGGVNVPLNATPPHTPSSNPTGFYPSPIDYVAYLAQPASPAVPDPTLPPFTFPPNPAIGTVVFSNNTVSGSTVISSGTSNVSTCANVTNALTGKVTPADPSYSFPVTAMLGPLNEGTYNFFYETEDCTSTAERLFTFDTTQNPATWVTKYKSLTFMVDNTAPTVSGSLSGPNPAILNGPGPTLNFTCGDTLSGLRYCGTTPTSAVAILGAPSFTGSNGPLSTAAIGSNHVKVYAQDQAGNTANTTVNYSVLYSTTGACLGDPGHQISPPLDPNRTVTFYLGVNIPASFRVCNANGVSIGTPGVIANIAVQIPDGDDDTPADILELLKVSTFHFDSTHQSWTCYIPTKNLERGITYAYTLTLNDGSTIAFRFKLK